jgi:hypothetical protein
MCGKLLPWADEEVYVCRINHDFGRMTMPGESCATPRGQVESVRKVTSRGALQEVVCL